MCFGGPTIPAAPAPPTATPKDDGAAMAAADMERRRRATLNGRHSTILTSAAGIGSPAPTAPKTILGA